MITIDDFVLGARQLGRDVDTNAGQRDVIRASPSISMRIVAGPGSGKTTVIVLRVLKLIFVNDVDPSSIVVTTFTKKAAAELRSRLLGWGDELRDILTHTPFNYPPEIISWLENLNINNVQTGTIDSIAQEVLADNRAPGETQPMVVESFACQSIMARSVILGQGLVNDQTIRNDLRTINGFPMVPLVGSMATMLIEFKDRFKHDQIDVNALSADTGTYRSMPLICGGATAYEQIMDASMLYDYSKLEEQFFNKLNDGSLNNFLGNIKFLLVDEYQDTNLLQENMYLAMGRAAASNGGSMVVVGDDDQSIYRFRGATVDLFTNLPNRAQDYGLNFRDVFLTDNYRSTGSIVQFCNRFATLDRDYQAVRIAAKPTMNVMRQTYTDIPILGMFRPTIDDLAHDLADFIEEVVNGPGYTFRDPQGQQHTIQRDPNRGSSADIALLCSSPNEYASSGRERLPYLLRRNLATKNPAINVFNPRGQSLQDVTEVGLLCGLMLECIDPGSSEQNRLGYLIPEITNQLNMWRQAAIAERRRNVTVNGVGLDSFVAAWQAHRPIGKNTWDKRDVPLVELAYKLISWIQRMQDDVEGLVYLEAVCRAITQAAFMTRYDSAISFDQNGTVLQGSVREAIENIFVPLASGAIQVNEDLLETLPRDRLNIMSVHQAKGLEFPLTIVDVGSDFKDLRSPAFKRFPTDGGKTCRVEDAVRAHSRGLNIGQRRGVDRAFDDLIRQYFVAYSRAQDVLLLVGLNSVRNGNRNRSNITYIPNVATGWDRTQIWRWGPRLPNLVHI